MSTLAARLTRHFDRVTQARARRGLPAPQIVVRTRDETIRHGDDRAFHAASIGKIATAALAMQFVDDHELALDTTAQSVLGPLPGLLRGEATLLQLIDHTSGAADYYDGPVVTGHRFQRLIVADPDRDWTPDALLAFSRERQHPIGHPGERFSYSDTGYALLGLVLEQVSGRPLPVLFADRIFGPLGMTCSWMPWRSQGVHPAIAPVRLGRTDVSAFRSITAGWAGGGIAATPDDLLRLLRGLRSGLVSADSLAEMSRIRHRVRPGLHYGAGLMEVRFEGFSPLLGRMPRLLGHTGSLATHLYHDPVHDTDIAINFHGDREMVSSVRTLITIVREVARAAD